MEAADPPPPLEVQCVLQPCTDWQVQPPRHFLRCIYCMRNFHQAVKPQLCDFRARELLARCLAASPDEPKKPPPPVNLRDSNLTEAGFVSYCRTILRKYEQYFPEDALVSLEMRQNHLNNNFILVLLIGGQQNAHQISWVDVMDRRYDAILKGVDRFFAEIFRSNANS